MKCLSQAAGKLALALTWCFDSLPPPLLAADTRQGWSPTLLRGVASGLSGTSLSTEWLLSGSFPHFTDEEMEVQTGHWTLPPQCPWITQLVGDSAGGLNLSLLAPKPKSLTLRLVEEGRRGTPDCISGAPWNPFLWPPSASPTGPL